MTGARPFDLWAQTPPALRSLLPNVMWDRARLHALELPVQHVTVAALRWQLDLPWWRDGDRPFAVTPNEVRAAQDAYARHWQRTLDANLAYPVDLLQRGRLVLLDGVHRLLKADVLGMDAIACHVLDEAALARIIERL